MGGLGGRRGKRVEWVGEKRGREEWREWVSTNYSHLSQPFAIKKSKEKPKKQRNGVMAICNMGSREDFFFFKMGDWQHVLCC